MAWLRARLVAHFRARHEWYWVPAIFCLAIAYIYREVFFPGDEPQRGLGWDTIEAYWADLAYLSGQIKAGEWPLWNPYERGGFPYFAIPERGAYYPVNWGFAGWGALVGEVSWWSIQLKGFLHHLIAATTMHLYLRSRGLPRSAGLVGGLAWLASAPLLIHKASSVIWPLVWLPLVWLAIDKLVERPTWRRGCGLGAALVLAGQAGSAPGFFYLLLLALPYGGFRVAVALKDARADQRLGPIARDVTVAVVIAALLTVAMLLVTTMPSAELTELSQRAKRSVAYALQFPLPVGKTLAGMWSPSAGKYDVYVGVLVLALVLCGIAMRPLRDRGVQILFLGAALFFLVLSFGQATPLLEWLVVHVPGFDMFRVSNRYKLLVVPLFAAGAGFGAASLIEASRSWSRERITAMAVALATIAVVAIVVWTNPVAAKLASKRPAEWLSIALAVNAALLVGAALFAPRRWAPVALVVVLPVVAYEPQHWVHFNNSALEKRVDNLADREWLEGLADVHTQYRIYDEFVLGQRAGSRLRIREFRSYPAGGSLEHQRYRRVIAYAKRHPEILGAFNIRYVFHRGHHRAGIRPNHFKRPLDRIAPRYFRRLHIPRCDKLANPAKCPVFEAVHVAPMVAWYGAATVEKGSGGQVLDALRRQLEGRGELRVVALEPAAAAAVDEALIGELVRASAEPPAAQVGEIVDFAANHVTVRVDAPAPGIVVVNEAMYPGWKVEVDGVPATPITANWLVRGVAVDAGAHEIHWYFAPRRHQLYRWLWSLGFLVILAAAVAPRRRRGDRDAPS